ncbi:SWIM zinc finger family protein [Streptomyces sp. NPDC006879]|uniref:SWIM zinc finger family protein n=1 Tax=Streptomyces sp. NPDC006879 TaxID=3364767 RepID=UPI0036BB582B
MTGTVDHRRRSFDSVPAGLEPDSWWGHAWVDALENRARDSARLLRGRAYAAEGRVQAITVTPGRIVAYVRGGRVRPYRAELRLETLAPEDWDRLLDLIAADPAHLAALLAREVPRALADLAARAGVRLLPGPGDLLPVCSCPDHGRPCKHAAALCYQVARLLDDDPFALLLMRGRGERELLKALSRRNAVQSARERRPRAPALPVVLAEDAIAAPVFVLPPPLPSPNGPGVPPAYPAAAGAPDPLALEHLAAGAAARAHALLTTGADPVAALTEWQDAVRLAAAHPTAGLTAGTRKLYRDLSRATARTPTELARAVAAWRQGGLAALSVLDDPWDPPAGPFDRARPLLLAAGLGAFRPDRNRLADAGRQIRLGRDGLWYPYESEPGQQDWWPRGRPCTDPVQALAAP